MIKHRKLENNNLPDIFKSKIYIYKKSRVKIVLFFEEYSKKVEVGISLLFMGIAEKCLDLRHSLHYHLCFFTSECVNGFHKNNDGIIKFVGSTLNAVNNEINFGNGIYN